MTQKHARLSASGSHRWLYCPGSVEAESRLPNTTSVHADEGTAAHELAEMALVKLSGDCSAWVGKSLIENNHHTVTQEMADYVQQYVDYVRSFSGTHAYEQRVDFGEWVPNGFGTADAIVVSDDTIRVIDLKYGRGIKVYAQENTQGLLYALGAYSENELTHDLKTVVISIVQPRLDHIDEWEIDVAELLKRGEWIRERANEAVKPNAKRIPSESACHWCKAKATCPALQKVTHEAIMTDFEALDLPATNTLSDDDLSRALGAKGLIIGWLDAVEAHITERVENGGFNGYKLVAGRSSRDWSDAKQAEAALVEAIGDDAFETKLLSVAKAEKALGKAKVGVIKDLIVKRDGRPTLVPEGDPRPSLSVTADDFENIK